MSVKIALAGNPNCGKTTLFNAQTGSNQFVGNWPGVTVEKKEGKLKGHKDVILTDLPGIYSLSPYTLEEVVARNYILQEKPDAIINIVDGTNIERNLYLTTQILELGIPVIMAVNMMDIVEKNGDTIHIDKLKKKLGCEVVTISALKGTGITEAANKAVSIAQSHRKVTPVHEFCDKAEEIIGAVENKLTGVVPEEQKRFFAIKLLERDDKIIEQMNTSVNVSAEIKEMENEFDDDTESIITNERYVYISSIIGQCVTKARKDKLSTSDKIDRIVTNRWLALPIFAVVMFIVYYVSVTTVGAFVTDWTNDVLFGEIIPPAIESGLNAIGCAAWLQGLILDGIVAGVGAVLGFVPQMLVLFAFLAFLESCGYMARVAFIMDRIFRKFGLSGKSFIPMLIGSGCGVPGVMASRTIENDRDRKMTIMTTTFVPCGAKLPIIAMIAGVLPFAFAANVGPFTDVKDTDWFASNVQYVYDNGLMNGTGGTLFEPSATTIRSMIVQILYNKEGSPAVSSSGTFSDVPSGKWFTNAVEWAASEKIVSGTGDSRFDPNSSITREQMAVILYNYAAYAGLDTSVRGDVSVFSGSGSIHSWAADAMSWAVGTGLLKGNENKLNPEGTASRAEVAQVLTNFDTIFEAVSN